MMGAESIGSPLPVSGRIQLGMEAIMGRGILLWLLGIPIPIIILLALFWY